MQQTLSHSLGDVSNFLVGSHSLPIIPFYIKTFTIPGIVLNDLKYQTRSGIPLHLGADSVDFGSLDLEIMLDGDFKTWLEIQKILRNSIDFKRDTFSMPEFDLWVLVLDTVSKNVRFKVVFNHCRFLGISELMLDPSAELGATFTAQVSYDWYDVITDDFENELKIVRKL